VRARWNTDITERLADGALEAARAAGAVADRFTVAGSFELPSAVAVLADTGRYDAVVPIGCLIKGSTPHFEFIADAVARGLMDLSLTYPIAIPFGVITCNTLAQARARAGGRDGNKGAEAMEAALEMVALQRSVRPSRRRSSRKASTAAPTSTSTKESSSPGRA
jgi:6,7-dimethyl-8-ribityllumazine synthase